MPRDGTGSFGVIGGARPRPAMNATSEYAKPLAPPRMNISRPDTMTRPPLGTGAPLRDPAALQQLAARSAALGPKGPAPVRQPGIPPAAGVNPAALQAKYMAAREAAKGTGGPMVNGVNPADALRARAAMSGAQVPGLAPYRGDMTKAPMATGQFPAGLLAALGRPPV